MELNKIEQLLETYFEGNTTLQEEEILKEYFASSTVAEHLKSYKPLFNSFVVSKAEVLKSEIKILKREKNLKPWIYSVAAIFLIALTVGSIFFSKPKHSQEEKEALAAFNKTKETMILLSVNLNKGTEKLAIIDQFKINKNKILK